MRHKFLSFLTLSLLIVFVLISKLTNGNVHFSKLQEPLSFASNKSCNNHFLEANISDTEQEEISSSKVKNSSCVIPLEVDPLRAERFSFPLKVQNLSHVIIEPGGHHLFSAYYDSRSSLFNRPAIVLLGYVKRHSSQSKLYYAFKFEDGTVKCSGREVLHSPLIAGNVWPEMYFCKFKPENGRIPVSVMVTKDPECDPSTLSSPIPVRNRYPNIPQEDVGVCVHGPLYELPGRKYDFFQVIVEFLAMVRALGATVVTLYPLNLDHVMLEKILQLYPNFVDIVQWINLNNTLHYYGQRILLNDCMYRNMYRVDHLAMIDIDEMILPVSTDDWPTMIKSIADRGKYVSYTFSNNFIEEESEDLHLTQDLRICDNLRLPKYFTRLNRLPWPNHKRNTKMKMIIRPKLISSSCIHDVCGRTVSGYSKTFWVPVSSAIMAHYRVPIDKWYVFGKGVEDRTAMKYKESVITEMKEKCI